MRVTRLKLANVRAIESAEFRFQPGFNLIVGVNGVGKTSVLDSLGVCLSAIVKHVNRLRIPIGSFEGEDIRVGADALMAECGTQIGASEHTYLIHKPRETSAPRKKKAGMPREQVHDTPERAEFLGSPPKPATGKEPEGRPLAVLFSTRRAVPSDRAPPKSVAAGGIPAAFADAFANRELRLGEFAAWMRVQQALKSEMSAAGRMLSAFEDTVTRFLPGYTNLRVNDGNRPKLLIDRGNTTLEVRQLSDGERGTLAMVLDLTRRLAQANPKLNDPAREAEAVALIDEIDLHLHPKWQRQIVANLATAFPRCQFIATTHSPQVIGEVEHDRIQIITAGQVYSPTHSFGVDSSRVLEEIMEAGPRTETVQDLLARLSRAIGETKYDNARALLAELIAQVGEDDPEVARVKTLLEFMEGKE
ncbi:MAG: ATP-binding protein [Alphaproteobacteria bacterium]|nr:MAG: ATP-binding protein [Alphaproteobacteria bacterium]